MRGLWRLWRLVAAGVALLSASGWALTPDAIFKQTEPAIVLIGNPEGFGSGIVIGANVLILTNYHVVNSVLPLTVKAKVTVKGRVAEQEFKGVKILKIHRTYDLALLQIAEPQVRFQALPLERAAKVATGARCYVIGNPDAGGAVLRNSITDGLVSANEREIEGLPYLQVSAAINPGNSGGAVVDAGGKLVGVVTFKVTETEGIGFAIPAAAINLKDFMPVAEKKGNHALGLQYEEKGRELWQQSQRVRDPELKKLLIYSACYYFRQCLAELPQEASPRHNVALMYYNLGEKELAQAYFAAALERDPNRPGTLNMLGVVLVEQQKEDEAQALWLRGAFLGVPDAASCAENAAVTAIRRRDFASAAYLVSLALVLDPQRNGENKQRILAEAAAAMSQRLLALIQAKQRPNEFSLAELKNLGKLEEQGQKDELAAAAKRDRDTAAQQAQLKKDLESLARPPPLADAWVSKKAPGNVKDVTPAMVGALVALRIEDLGKVVLLDTGTGEQFKYLTVVSPEYLMAGGGTALFVYYPTLKILETHDLKTLKKVQAKPVATDAPITALAVGLRNPATAFVTYGVGTPPAARRQYGLLDLATMGIRPLAGKAPGANDSRPNVFRHQMFSDAVRLAADRLLDHATIYGTSGSPSGYEYVTFDLARAQFESCYEHTTYGGLGLSPEGEYVFCTGGWVLQRDKQLKEFRGSALCPVLDGAFFLELQDGGKIVVRETYSLAELRSFDAPFKPGSGWRHQPGPVSLERRVVASALTNRITILDPATNTLYTRPLLPGGLGPRKDGTAGNSLTASPGQKWTFDLLLQKGFTAKIEDAPAGVTLKGGSLNWSVPATANKGMVEILLSVKDASGAESYRTVRVVIR